MGGADAFINKDTLLFGYYDGGIEQLIAGKKTKEYMGIINLATGEKKTFSDCSKGRCIVGDTHNLNNRYIMWKWYSVYYIFDIKDMKIVQEINSKFSRYTVSEKFKKVVFYNSYNNKLDLYNIAQGE